MKQMSLGQYPSMNGSSAMTGVKQIRTSVMMFGGGPHFVDISAVDISPAS